MMASYFQGNTVNPECSGESQTDGNPSRQCKLGEPMQMSVCVRTHVMTRTNFAVC